MVIMALDHVSGFVARIHSMEFWGAGWTHYSSPIEFLTRFVTHLCAPGFFFLMGAGMALYTASRMRAGWDQRRVSSTVLKRGIALALVSVFLELPAMVIGGFSGRVSHIRPGEEAGVPGAREMPYFVMSVILALGFVMMAASRLLHVRDWVWWIAGVGSAAATLLLTPTPDQSAVLYPIASRVLLIPGMTFHVLVIYPIIPWFALTAFGVLFGRALHRRAAPTIRLAPWIGLGLVAAAIVLRATSGPGNQRLPRDESWMEFLNFIKYPPTLVFSLFMIGVNLMLLGALDRFGRGLDGLRVFGQSPLAYYIAHLYLYGIIGALFFRDGAPLWVAYAVWLAGLVPLYFFSRWYRAFKESKPAESFWRMF